MKPKFGILTLATSSDYLKAIGLALSARISNPGVPLAVACGPSVAQKIEPYFDFVIPERPGMRGFLHKIYLDEYTPFSKTFFFDSDVLLFRPVSEIVDIWDDPAYGATGRLVRDGVSAFGLDRSTVLNKLEKPEFSMIDGAGHALFKLPEARPLFLEARRIASVYGDIAGDIRFADEDAVGIAMTILGIRPIGDEEFFSRRLSAKRGTLQMDSSKGKCQFIDVTSGVLRRPWMMHFAANEAPIRYTLELIRLFRLQGLPIRGLFSTCLQDVFEMQVRWPLGKFRQKIFSWFNCVR